MNPNPTNPLAKFIVQILDFINAYLVPLVFALAFILFLFGVFRYFFAGTSDEKRKEGRTFILWGIIALAIMIAVWGLVNLVVNSLGFNNASRPCLPTFAGNGNCTTTVPGTSSAGSSAGSLGSGTGTTGNSGLPPGFGDSTPPPTQGFSGPPGP